MLKGRGWAQSARWWKIASGDLWGHCRGYQIRQILYLTSLPVCRDFEQPPVLHSFAVRGRQSHLGSLRNFSSMKTKTLSFFGPYQQYVHQIKAENILNSNLTSDQMICYKQLCIGTTFQFLIWAKMLTCRLWWRPVAIPYNLSKNIIHQQMLIDAKRNVKRFQISNCNNHYMACNPMSSGHFVPTPGPDRVKTPNWGFTMT